MLAQDRSEQGDAGASSDQAAARTYDRARSSRHEYLSTSGLLDAECQSALTNGQIVDLPYIVLDSVLFPEQKLPLLLRGENGRQSQHWQYR
jgi:hypothetical protein